MARDNQDGSAQRQKLPPHLLKAVRSHFGQRHEATIAAFTVERNKSLYPKAKADLIIFDGNGAAVMEGREFGGGQTSLWIK